MQLGDCVPVDGHQGQIDNLIFNRRLGQRTHVLRDLCGFDVASLSNEDVNCLINIINGVFHGKYY